MEVIYSHQIYTSEVLLLAIKDYREYAKIEISESTLSCSKLRFSECKYGLFETVQEFNNYLIELLNASEKHVVD